MKLFTISGIILCPEELKQARVSLFERYSNLLASKQIGVFSLDV
jgi:hypothetical protein